MSDQTLTLPHEYTEGDVLPFVIAAFPFDISTFNEIAAIVERPDATVFERVGVAANAHQVQFNWIATDWIEGCSRMTLRLKDASDKISHLPTVIIKTLALPPAVP
jgi:hypothetical protein